MEAVKRWSNQKKIKKKKEKKNWLFRKGESTGLGRNWF